MPFTLVIDRTVGKVAPAKAKKPRKRVEKPSWNVEDVEGEIATLILDTTVLWAINHSGGKDSQAMMISMLERGIPRAQMVVVHATLGMYEHPGALEVAQADAERMGIPFIVARNTTKADLLNAVDHRFKTRPDVPSWFSFNQRYCTAEFKRNPVQKALRHFAKEHGFTTVVNAMGLRGQESPKRMAKHPLIRGGSEECKSRKWYEWMPIKMMELKSEDGVWATIARAGWTWHTAYDNGWERLSCVFCMLASYGDIRRGAKEHPELAAHYIAMEKRTGYTMKNGISFEEILAGKGADHEGNDYGKEGC